MSPRPRAPRWRLPTAPLCFRFKVSGELPLVHIHISDEKIRNILDLLNSVPLPSLGSAAPTPTDKVGLRGSGGHRERLRLSSPRSPDGFCVRLRLQKQLLAQEPSGLGLGPMLLGALEMGQCCSRWDRGSLLPGPVPLTPAGVRGGA